MKLSILDPGGIGLARGSPLKATVQGVARGMFQNVDGGLQAFYRGRVLSDMGIKARLQVCAMGAGGRSLQCMEPAGIWAARRAALGAT